MRTFTLDEARDTLPDLLELADELVEVRAELTEQRVASGPGSLADAKGLEARLADLLERIVALGVEVKGWAPLLVDFPVAHDDRVVLVCWLEGDRELAWYHEIEHGFPGRRPLAHLDS
ncbi:MAG TPA: DUF2203 domain-containing protein [Acidimicrobiales bacterium]